MASRSSAKSNTATPKSIPVSPRLGTTLRSILSSRANAGSESTNSTSTTTKPIGREPNKNTIAKSDQKRLKRSVEDIERIGLIGVFRKIGFWAFGLAYQNNVFN